MAQLASYTQLQTALQAGQQAGIETIHQAIKDLQNLAETVNQRHETLVDVGQRGLETQAELVRVKTLVEDNDRMIKQKLEANDTNLKQTVDTEVARIKEAGQGLEAKVMAAEQQLQDTETKHAMLLQEAQKARQDIQKAQSDTQQTLITMQKSMSDALGGQAQELAEIRKFQASLGSIEEWATGVNVQLGSLNDMTAGLQTSITDNNRSVADLHCAPVGRECLARRCLLQPSLPNNGVGSIEHAKWHCVGRRFIQGRGG